MFWSPLYPPSKQREVAALMRESDPTMAAIAERSGVAYPTLARWNREQGWRPSAARPSLARRVRRWPPARAAALSRVHRVLRDLVGLKRLLDELDAGPDAAEDDEEEPITDIGAFRADIARRHLAFETQETARAQEVEAARRAAEAQEATSAPS